MTKQNRNVYQKRITKKDQLLGILIGMEIEEPGRVSKLTPDERVEICEMCSIEGAVEYKNGKLVKAGIKDADIENEFHGGTEPRAADFYISNLKSKLTNGKSKKLPIPVFPFEFA